jgi:ligand-binding sensor domain-containing protein
MITVGPKTASGSWGTRRILLLCALCCTHGVAAEPRPAPSICQVAPAEHRDARMTDLKFTHLTTNDGLSQGYVVDILQDRSGFMWFATRDGPNRYDGYSFVVYKHDPNDPGSLSSNFLQDLAEDGQGHLWVATNNGVNRFDPTTERCTRYLHDPDNPDTLGGASVKSVAQDHHGYFWFGTEDGGLDRLDPRLGTFTHHRSDSEGRFVGRITQVIKDRHGDIWFTGERGLFQLDQQTGQVIRRPAAPNGLSADSLYEDEAGDLWMLTNSPVAGLVRYDRRTQSLTSYPVAPRAVGTLASTTTGDSLNGTLAADGQHGLWVPSSDGLCYFDRRRGRFTHTFQHEDANRHSLDSSAIFSVYQDRGGVLWVGTENSGLNILNFRQHQFVHHMHRSADPRSLSPGRVKAIHRDPDGVVWVGLFPRALDRLDRKTGQIIHYLPREGDDKKLGPGTNVNSIYRDPAGHLWVGGGGSGLVRFDQRAGRFKHYRHDARDPKSLVSNNVYTIQGDRRGQMWVGLEGGISRRSNTRPSRSPKAATRCRACGHRWSNTTISRGPSRSSATSSPPTRGSTGLRRSEWPSRGNLEICTRSSVTRSTRSRRKRFETRSGMRTPGGSRSRSDTMKSSSGYACATMARASIRRCSRAREPRGTTDCAACRNAFSRLFASGLRQEETHRE